MTVEQHGQQKAQHHDDQHVEHGEDHGVPQGDAEGGIAENDPVVFQTGEVKRPKAVPVGKAHHDGHQHGHKGKSAEADQIGKDKQPAGNGIALFQGTALGAKLRLERLAHKWAPLSKRIRQSEGAGSHAARPRTRRKIYLISPTRWLMLAMPSSMVSSLSIIRECSSLMTL